MTPEKRALRRAARRIDQDAPVSMRLVLAALRHGIKEAESLFEWADNGRHTEAHDRDQIERGFVNTFTGPELELMTAAFHRTGYDKEDGFGQCAEFASINEWVTLAAGHDARGAGKDRNFRFNRSEYIAAIKTLKKPHAVMYAAKAMGRRAVFYTETAPVSVSSSRAGLRVNLAPVLTEADHYMLIPLGLAAKIRRGMAPGARITRPIILLYWELRRRFSANCRKQNMDLHRIFSAIGLGNAHRNTARDFARIEKALQAFQKVKILDGFRILSRGQIEIAPNRFHFGRRGVVGAIDAEVGVNDAIVGVNDASPKAILGNSHRKRAVGGNL